MTVSDLLTPNISGSSNFYNLAIFICQLFTDGQFRTGHIIYDPNVFSSELITEIQLNCPYSIPWIMTDVNRPPSQLWQPNQNTDRILQLVFFDPDYLPKDTDDFNQLHTFYRIFVISSANQKIVERKITMLEQSKMVEEGNSVILVHESSDGSIRIHRSETMAKGDQICLDDKNKIETYDQMCELERRNLFDHTFGEYDQTWLTTVGYTGVHRMNESYSDWKQHELLNGKPFIANFFVANSYASYVNRTEYIFRKTISSVDSRIVRHKYHKFYEELTTDYSTIDQNTL